MTSRRVLVSGSSRGIGRAIALCLARDGFSVTVHCRSRSAEAAGVVSEIRAAGGEADFLMFDVRDRAVAGALLEETVSENGAYYGIVCNAGVSRDAAFPALTGEDWDSVLDTSLDGFFNVVQTLIMPVV